MTSGFGPDNRVYVGFDSGVNTPLADVTWTEISDRVEFQYDIPIGWGRADTQSVASANTCSLVLDNSDGRFTPDLSTSPYYPNVDVDRPIKITATLDGTTTTRFTGYVDEWPIDWSDGTDETSYARLTASSRLARLGEGAELRSIIETEIMVDNPVRYYPMGESGEFGHCLDLTGNDQVGMYSYYGGDTIVLQGANGPKTDGLSAPQISPFISGDPEPPQLTAYFDHTMTAVTLECFMLLPRRNVDDTVAIASLYQGFADSDNYRVLQFNATSVDVGATTVSFFNSGYTERTAGVTSSLGSSTVYADPATAIATWDSMFASRTHHIALTFQPGAVPVLKTYVDGVLFNTNTGLSGPGPLMTTMPDWKLLVLGPYLVASNDNPMVVSHAAVFDSILSDDRIQAHADAGLNGFAGETADDRITRYANYAQIETSVIDADTGVAALSHIDTTGKTVESLLRIIEATESGVLYDGRDGTLAFRDRDHRYTATSAFTLDVAAHTVQADSLRPVRDRTGLINEVTAKSAADSTVEQRYSDAASRTRSGPKRADVDIASENADELYQAAASRVNRYKDPRTRIPSLEPVDVLTLDDTLRTAIVNADISTMFTVDNLPAQAASSSLDFFVEGGVETLGLESWRFQFNVSPADVYTQVWTVEDPVLGQYDTYPLAY